MFLALAFSKLLLAMIYLMLQLSPDLSNSGGWSKGTERFLSRAGLEVHRGGNFMNTYLVSKNLTERLVMSYGKKGLNVCITRPTMVTGIAGDPCPGYIGNTSGLTGIMLGAAYGECSPFPTLLCFTYLRSPPRDTEDDKASPSRLTSFVHAIAWHVSHTFPHFLLQCIIKLTRTYL
jgi:hypothetical protein